MNQKRKFLIDLIVLAVALCFEYFDLTSEHIIVLYFSKVPSMKLRNVLAIDISRLLMPLPVALDLQIQPVFSECKRSPFLMIPGLLSALLR